ncbi:hypothetical protein BU16DRAFT_332256 [Lophium mytilinum]|uniref:Uncharacterized protein n=1 Tax=Lophium mytilinum TaxID=390894 RepID=A0A6A6R0H5_9PEZI|nr:hypothetical protein BU16DRAFT_332256 [Lophium mytilinum]
MCHNCNLPNPKAQVISGVSWAVPVDIVRLAPHLEAYEEAKPAITALRLCHRFGAGPDAHITKLPLELIEIIAELMQQESRLWKYLEWKEDYDCFQESCELEDHFDEEDTAEFYRLAREQMGIHPKDCSEPGCEACIERLIWQEERRGHHAKYCEMEDCDDCLDGNEYSDAGSDESDDGDENLVDLVVELMSEGGAKYDIHSQRGMNWEERVFQFKCCKDKRTPKIDKLLKILELDFGLSAVISHQRIKLKDAKFVPYDYSLASYDEAAKTTLCYLTLPHKVRTDFVGNEDLWSCEGEVLEGYNFMSTIIDRSTLDITEKQRLRFGRTMKRLGLKPYFHFSQVGDNLPTSLSTDDQKTVLPANTTDVDRLQVHKRTIDDMNERVKRLERSEWPKLMSLVASSMFMCK